MLHRIVPALLVLASACGQATASLPPLDVNDDPITSASVTIAIPAQSGSSPTWAEDNAGRWRTSTGNGYLVVPIAMQVGDELSGASFLVAGNDATDVSVVLYVNSAEMYQTTAAHITLRRPGVDWVVNPMDVTPHRIAVNEAAFIAFLASAAGVQIGNVSVTYRR